MTTTTLSYNTLAPVKAVRRARRAYIGVLGLAFERAAERIDILRARRDDLMVDLMARGENAEGEATSKIKNVQSAASNFTESRMDALTKFVPALPFGQAKRIEELEAEVSKLTKKLAKATKANTAKTKSVKAKAVKPKTAKVVTPKPNAAAPQTDAPKVEKTVAATPKTAAPETAKVAASPKTNVVSQDTGPMASLVVDTQTK